MQASGFADLYNNLGVGLYGSFQLAACERRRSRLAGARGLLTSATDASPNEPEFRCMAYRVSGIHKSHLQIASA